MAYSMYHDKPLSRYVIEYRGKVLAFFHTYDEAVSLLERLRKQHPS